MRILETTDLHVHVYPHDYYADRPSASAALANTATLIARLRRGAANSLLLDNGDFLQGNPMGDYIAYARGMAAGQTHPAIDAMNVLRYDAGALGNHEFNYGLDFLLNTVAGANFPLVSANISLAAGSDPRRDKPLLRPYVLLDRMLTDGAGQSRAIRIGIIGFLPPQVMIWDHKYLHNRASCRDIVQSARAWLPELKEAGADLVIALSHSGIGPGIHRDGAENASLALAREPLVDVVLTGHSHQVFPPPIHSAPAHMAPDVDPVRGTLAGKPATMAGFWGSHVGTIDLVLEQGENGWQIAASASVAQPVIAQKADGQSGPRAARNRTVIAAVRQVHAETLAYMRRPVGRNPVPLHSYFALVADVPAIRLVALAQMDHVRRALRGTRHAGLPVLSAAAPFKAGGLAGPGNYTDVPAGPLALRNIADLYIYPNVLRAIKLTGADLANWLERAASLFLRVAPGLQDQPLLNPQFPSYNFDMVQGVTYAIDLTQPPRFDATGALLNPAARRIRGLSCQGKPVDPAAEFVMATNDYRAHGGGDFPGADGTTVIYQSTQTNRDAVLSFIRSHGTDIAGSQPAWHFAPIAHTSALFETGPGAALQPPGLALPHIEPAGPGSDGFITYRLHF